MHFQYTHLLEKAPVPFDGSIFGDPMPAFKRSWIYCRRALGLGGSSFISIGLLFEARVVAKANKGQGVTTHVGLFTPSVPSLKPARPPGYAAWHA